MHKPEDRVDEINTDYWLEQMKATAAFAANLAVPTAPE
jgi:hypothetical protein